MRAGNEMGRNAFNMRSSNREGIKREELLGQSSNLPEDYSQESVAEGVIGSGIGAAASRVKRIYKAGDIVQGPDGGMYRILTLTPEGMPNDVEAVV